MLEGILKHENEYYKFWFNPGTKRMSYMEKGEDKGSVVLEDVVALIEFTVETVADMAFYHRYIAESEDRDFFAECAKTY